MSEQNKIYKRKRNNQQDGIGAVIAASNKNTISPPEQEALESAARKGQDDKLITILE